MLKFYVFYPNGCTNGSKYEHVITIAESRTQAFQIFNELVGSIYSHLLTDENIPLIEEKPIIVRGTEQGGFNVIHLDKLVCHGFGNE